MGRKSRDQIEEEFYQQQYRRYLELKANPKFKSVCKKLSQINKKIARIEQDYKKIPSSTPHKAIYPDDPEYSTAMKRYELRQKLGTLEEKKESLERVLVEEYGFTIPMNPFEEEITLEDLKEFPLFQDSKIIRDLPFKKPELISDSPNSQRSKLDFTGYLHPDPKTGEPRYLRIDIDTWNPIERIVVATKERLEFLRDSLGIIKFRSRYRKTKVDAERILQMRAQGMSMTCPLRLYHFLS